MKPMKSRWTRAQAQTELDAWRSSGQSIEAFAEQRGVAAYRLRYWQKRIGDSLATTRATSSVSLLPVRVARSSNTPIEIILPSGYIARVSPGFDEDTLLRLFSLLESR
jgi:hypothetical protein